MKRLLSFAMMIVVVGSVFFLGYDDILDIIGGYQSQIHVKTPIEAAIAIEQNAKHGICETKLKFDEPMDVDYIFLYFEAISQYSTAISFKYSVNDCIVILTADDLDKQTKAIAEVQAIARDLIKDDMSIIQRIEVIHNYVVMNIVYDVKAAEDIKNNPRSLTVYGALEDKTAVCAGYSRMFSAMCEAVGIETIYISDEQMNHGFNLLSYYGDMYYVDTTYDDPIPDRGNRVSTKYFMVDKETLSKTHTWDKRLYDGLTAQFYDANYEYIQRLQDKGVLSFEILNSHAQDPLDITTLKSAMDGVARCLGNGTFDGDYTSFEDKGMVMADDLYLLLGSKNPEQEDYEMTIGRFAKIIYERYFSVR